ncbi:MAG: ribosomal L7Ae/L30e/S12e/Gadd45 family protein [Aristaeellaceae bacterium]
MEDLINAASKAVGTRQVLRGLKAGTLSRVYVANDADTYLFQQVVRAAEDAGVPAVRVQSMKELGQALGLEVACAAAAIVK